MVHPVRLLLLVLAALALLACGGEAGLPVATWTLDAQSVHRELSLPAHFDQELGDHEQQYVLRTKVQLPPSMQGRRLTLTIAYFGGLASLRAGGLEAPDVDASEFERFRSNGPHRFLIPPDATRAASLDLEMTVEHRWTQSAWLDTVPVLAPGERGDTQYAFVSTFDQGSAAAALSMILLVGVAYALVFLSDRKRSAFGWFVLASFSGASYAAWTLGILQPVFGAHDPAVV